MKGCISIMNNKDIKPSDILKWLVGTKEGREYYRKEVEQWCHDIAASMEKQLFGKEEKVNILDEYLASAQVMPSKEFRQGAVLTIAFEQMAYEIADVVVKRREELPDEECFFVLTCKIYRWKEYKEAHPKVFKREVKE